MEDWRMQQMVSQFTIAVGVLTRALAIYAEIEGMKAYNQRVCDDNEGSLYTQTDFGRQSNALRSLANNL